MFQLCRAALPDPNDRTLFMTLMAEASAKGLDWIESLEYAALRRFQHDRPGEERTLKPASHGNPVG